MILILIVLLTLLEVALKMVWVGASIRNRIKSAEFNVSQSNKKGLLGVISSKIKTARSSSENIIKGLITIVGAIRNSLFGVGVVVLLIKLLVILIIIVAVAAYLLLLNGGSIPPVY